MSIQTKFSGAVRNVSTEGLGVVDHPDGRVFFVAGVIPGDVGEFEIERIERRYGCASLVALTTASTDRVEAPCSYHGFSSGRCGGCPWMMADYAAQLKLKYNLVNYAVERAELGVEVLPVLPSADTLHYRNRAQFKTDGNQFGFVTAGTRDIVDIKTCSVLNSKCADQLAALRTKLPNTAWKPAEEAVWNFIDVDDQHALDQIVPNRRLPFRQGNSAQNAVMKQWVYQSIASLQAKHALELFCGSGNFTEELVRAGIPKIDAVEANFQSLEELRARKWSHVMSQKLDLFKAAPKEFLAKLTDVDVMLLDPPRDGFELLTSWVKALSQLQSVIYISCSFPTFIRDVKSLAKSGWSVQTIQPIDLFPHTPHVELMSVLTKM